YRVVVLALRGTQGANWAGQLLPTEHARKEPTSSTPTTRSRTTTGIRSRKGWPSPGSFPSAWGSRTSSSISWRRDGCRRRTGRARRAAGVLSFVAQRLHRSDPGRAHGREQAAGHADQALPP